VKNISNTDILLVSHISDLSGPTEALENFLKAKASSLVSILNPLDYCTIAKRKVSFFKKDKKPIFYNPINIKWKSFFTWIFDSIVIFYYSLYFRKRYDLYIGCNGFNAFLGIILKKLKIVKKVIFYTIDWTENRFSNKFYNHIYHFVDKYAAKNCDYTWSISQKIDALRKKQGIQAKRNILVPVGVDWEKIDQVEPEKADFKKIVFLGALEKTKGIELTIKAWPKVCKAREDVQLIVIGKTPVGAGIEPYEEKLRKMYNISLVGILSHEEVLRRLPSYGVGLAPYTFCKESISQFADPSRVKDYLACGLPVIITEVPQIAKEIKEYEAGEIISADEDAIVEAVLKITASRQGYRQYRQNALKLGSKYKWGDIFSGAFQKMNFKI